MGMLRSPSLFSWFGVWTFITLILSFCTQASAAATQWIEYNGGDGDIWLDNNRQPALFTKDFGDCQGDSLINVTRFDAAYYKDNMTVIFHLQGNTALAKEAVMMYIGVYAYGENRFNLTFDPCYANIRSMCPVNSSVPIEASGIVPIAPADVAGIPNIALTIPDFEGQAILRIFANSTQSQIACYSAVFSNGNSFSHPAAVGSTLGVFVVIALISSVAVAVYGQAVPETRKHHSHSLSMFVVFSVLQSIFFTGGLSVNFPSVLVAFWSNFGWASGMIYSRKMQNTINQFIGSNRGNISVVGAAPSGQLANNFGGGYSLSQIYKRTMPSFDMFQNVGQSLQSRSVEHALSSRSIDNVTTGFVWYGHPVAPGLPLPGNYSGFAGTLAQLNIPASNAFMTGFLWLLVLIGLVGASLILLKWTIEALAAVRLVKTDRLSFFRQHWLWFTGAAVLRTCFIAFFMMIFLTLFQFTLGGAVGVRVLAGVVFVIFLIGMIGAAAYALWYRLRSEKWQKGVSHLKTKSRKRGAISGLHFTQDKPTSDKDDSGRTIASFPNFIDPLERPHVHDDEDYIMKFGWLSSRFRRSKWWLFSFWLIYELVRACFYGGGAGHPLVQVFGLLAWEIIALVAIVIMKPFESNRLNLLMVYFCGFSKVTTVALSSAFDPRFNLGRILTTVIGVIIIVIQGLLTICLLIAVVLGAVSSWMSIRRYEEDFKPRSWQNKRARFFEHIDYKDTDKPRPPPPPPPPMPELPKEPYFTVASVRRQPKIEDEDPDNEEYLDFDESRLSLHSERDRNPSRSRPASRAQSIKSRNSTSNLPYGARRHRASWSTHDFNEAGLLSNEQLPSGTQSRISVDNIREAPMRHRAASMRNFQEERISATFNERPMSSVSTKHRSRRSLSNTHGSKRQSATVHERTQENIPPIPTNDTL